MPLIKIDTVTISPRDIYFFDANVWIFLYGNLYDYKRVKQNKYSNFLQEVLTRKSCIYINSLIISEVANVLLRAGFNDWKDESRNYSASFKEDYVKSDSYNSKVSEIKLIIESILTLECVEKTSDDFNNIPLDSLLDRYGDLDFNDNYLYVFCKRRSYTFVTDDSDFFNLDFNVVH